MTSCWYWPTPMDFGSILTSSASGSCRRRAIDTAPLMDTSSSGSSREAYPTPSTPKPCLAHGHLGRCLMSCRGDLRDEFGCERIGLTGGGAIADGDQFHPCRATRAASAAWTDPTDSGLMWEDRPVSTTLPVPSTTATFTPVRKPGSRPRVARAPAGAASNRS